MASYNIVCFTRITYAHHIKGGMELQTLVLSEGLVRRGHRVTILTTSLTPDKGMVRNENGVIIHYLPVHLPARYSPEYWEQSVKRFTELHRRAPFDIVWGEGVGGIGYVKGTPPGDRPPLFSFVQGSFMGVMRSKYNSALFSGCSLPRALWRFSRGAKDIVKQFITDSITLYRACDAIICPSPQNQRLLRIEARIPPEKLFVTVNGIDVDQFKPDAELRRVGRSRLCASPDDFILLVVTRITEDKGVHILLDALAVCLKREQRLRLIVIGDGPHRSALQTQARHLGVSERVRFMGIIDNTLLPLYYNACDAAICPTLCVESYGISNAEAMACGKPVISSASGGTRYVIEHGVSGLHVPPGRTGALTRAILKVAKNPELAAELGANGRKRAVARLSDNRMIDDVEAVIGKVLTRKARLA